MSRRRTNGTTGANSNINNNTDEKAGKPYVPSKPPHLTGLKGTRAPLSNDIVTPKGWTRQQKFTFGQSDEKGSQNAAGLKTQPEYAFNQKWRPAPKISQKGHAGKRFGAEKNNTRRNTTPVSDVGRRPDHDSTMRGSSTYLSDKPRRTIEDEDSQKGFGSLKRMWSEKAKSPCVSTTQRNFDYNHLIKTTEEFSCKNEVESPGHSSQEESTNVVKHPVARSTSSSSNGSVRTASFKDKQATWHYVTVNPDTNNIPADALPSKIEVNEPPLANSSHPRKFDHKILAPKPFHSSFDESPMAPVQKPRPNNKQVASSHNKDASTKSSRKSRLSRRRKSLSDEDSNSAAEDSDEAEMRIARRKGTLVTRFDSRGNMYKVNPRNGDIYVDEESTAAPDKENTKSEKKRPPASLKRMNAISIEGATVMESSDNGSGKIGSKRSDSSDEEVPPPILPRERISHRSGGSVVPPRSGKMPSSMTDHSLYSQKSYMVAGDLSPEFNVPPPLLPRGETAAPTTLMDYTPMTGTSTDIPIHDKGSVGSSISINSFLDQAAYEPMEPKQEPQTGSPTEEEEIFTNYSAAIDPPKLKHQPSIREYHEIDPDSSIDQTTDGVPPPPEQEPPSLPGNSRYYSRSSSQNTHDAPESPPPLPPLNPQKKLNYIDVEIGSGGAPNLAEHRKSQKINYTEVVVAGGIHKDESDTKKGKSVKEKLLAMISSNKAPDGYASEGDAIAGSKNEDDRTTDFSKERNKLKRLSGRLLRRKKQKSKHVNRQSNEYEISRPENKNVHVAVYGSATNLSTTSSESSRSLTQIVSNNSGSSGDGQARPHASQGINNRKPAADRRQSFEPALTQLPPKLEEKSRSEAHLNSPISLSRSPIKNQDYSFAQSTAVDSTHSQAYKTCKSSKDTKGSPVISAPRVESHLHQNRGRPSTISTSPRPVSEPPVMDYLDMEGSQSHSGSSNQEGSKLSPRPSKSHDRINVSPLPIIKDIKNESIPEKLSPDFPADSPPPPPSIESIPPIRPPPPSTDPPNLPPAPMRELKPDRFKKRPHSQDPSHYTAAENIRNSAHGDDDDKEDPNDPIYDAVCLNVAVPPPRITSSGSSKSKLLESEPLYQVYRSRTLSHASMKGRSKQMNKRRFNSTNDAPVKGDISDKEWQSDLMTDDAGATTLWREVKEVVQSGVGNGLSVDEMKLQQAQFEVVTSQASYMRSLNILIDHFMGDPAMQNPDVLPRKQRKVLFSNIVDVRKTEQGFLQEIEQHFWDKLRLTDIAKIAARYASSDFEVYVRYVQNQVYQDRILTDLQRNNDRFAVELSRLESSPACNKLPLLSFLLLPMQRVTRLPLLISAIVNQADAAEDKEAYVAAKKALVVVNKLVKKCNEGARKMQQTEQLAEIAKELKFASSVKTYAIISQSRSLVKKGDMSAIMALENGKTKSMRLWLFLFTDVLLLAKKKTFLDSGTNAKYEVIDWAKRAMLYVNERAVSENEIFLVLLENCNLKRVELTLTPSSANELSRWTDALDPQHANESEDSIYESWDCPQYTCINPYTAEQPDELSLDIGDVMRVLKKTGDGWLEGERLRDNETGWFPASRCEEIEDEHVRARNLKNLYRVVS